MPMPCAIVKFVSLMRLQAARLTARVLLYVVAGKEPPCLSMGGNVSALTGMAGNPDNRDQPG
jgi:hypothetical protein